MSSGIFRESYGIFHRSTADGWAGSNPSVITLPRIESESSFEPVEKAICSPLARLFARISESLEEMLTIYVASASSESCGINVKALECFLIINSVII